MGDSVSLLENTKKLTTTKISIHVNLKKQIFIELFSEKSCISS